MDPVTSSEWVVGRPTAPLRPFVGRYVGYRMTGYEPGVHRGLPSGGLTFIVAIEQRVDVERQSSAAQGPRSYGALLSGLHTSPALIAHDGNQQGVAIELTPLGARVLFGLPAAALWDLTLELDEVAGPSGQELWERVQLADGWAGRFAACDEVLRRLAVGESTPPVLAHCWTTLQASEGSLPIEALARDIGYSRQHLTRRFRAEFGLTPKLAARVFRFGHAIRQLRSAPGSLGEIAAVCGYADQAHLTRDFSAFAGCSPTTWLREEQLPIVQDAAASDASD